MKRIGRFCGVVGDRRADCFTAETPRRRVRREKRKSKAKKSAEKAEKIRREVQFL